MYTVYILQSSITQKYYIGQTQNLENRIMEHNSGETKSIKSSIPWKCIWSTNVPTRSEAVLLEKKIKNIGAGRFLNNYGGSSAL